MRATASPSRRTAAIKLANWARERVPLYRELYGGLPSVTVWDDFLRLPVLTAARLRATPLCDQVDVLDDVLRSQTAYALASEVTPRTVVLDADDSGAEFDQTRAAFALLGLRKGARLALVAPPERRYAAAEIADKLGYFGIEAHVVIALDPAVVARTLGALAPERAVSLGARLTVETAGLVTTREPEGDAPDLYLVPEVGIVAVRANGADSHRVLTRYFLIEATVTGTLLLTAVLRYHQPLIRYELPDRGRIRRGRLLLDEVAT